MSSFVITTPQELAEIPFLQELTRAALVAKGAPVFSAQAMVRMQRSVVVEPSLVAPEDWPELEASVFAAIASIFNPPALN